MENKTKESIRATLIELGISPQIIEKVLVVTSGENEAIELALALTEQPTQSANDYQLMIKPDPDFRQAERPQELFNKGLTHEGIPEECKMVFLVRNDLNMGVGKIAAQVGHAGKVNSYRKLSRGSKVLPKLRYDVGTIWPG